MPARQPRGLVLGALLAALLVGFFVAGCGEPGGGAPAADGEVRTYRVRGEVTAVSGRNLAIRHEAIDDFEDASGEIVGMDSMTMTFSVEDEVPLEEIEAGTRIRFELAVNWDQTQPASITEIEVLRPGTELEFRAAEPAHLTPSRGSGS